MRSSIRVPNIRLLRVELGGITGRKSQLKREKEKGEGGQARRGRQKEGRG